MKLIVNITDKDYEKLKDGHIPFSIHDAMQNGTPIPDNATVCDIEQIRAEIEKPLRVERYADTESAKAQAIALSWCLEVIDKYTE